MNLRSHIQHAGLYAVVMGITLSLWSAAAANAQATDAEKCAAGKMRLAGKYAVCRLRADAKAETKMLPADYTKCDTKQLGGWTKIETRYGPACLTSGDQAEVQTDVTSLTTCLATDLSGTPGSCDLSNLNACNADLAACSDSLATCYAGTATEADVASGKTFSSSSGPGLTGTLTYCGDGIQDAGEQCDGSSFDPGLVCGGGCLANCQCRFVDNGNQTVTDNQTHLIWEQKNDSGGAIHDKDNVYSWSSSGTAPDGTAFTAFLATLNDAGGGTCPTGGPTGGCCPLVFFADPSCMDVDCFAGDCDWRLPTMAELRSILLAAYPCGVSPCIDSVFGPTRLGGYWSGSIVGGSSGAWYVNFNDSGISIAAKTSSFFVRAVRSGS